MSTIHPVREIDLPNSPERVRIGLCTDTHYWPQSDNHVGSAGNIQLLGESERLLRALVAEFAAANLDMALHLGDFTCGGGYFGMPTQEFYPAVDTVHSVFEQLPFPMWGLPGNHDCPPGGGRWAYAEQRWGLAPGMGSIIDLPHARLVLLNAQGHSDAQIAAAKPDDPIYGWVDDAELAHFDHALATAGERPVIVCLHQLLQRWSGNQEWSDFYAVQNAAAVLAIIAKHGNVRAVFQGHAHRFDVQQMLVGERPTTFVITPAVVEYPLGWLLLDVAPDRLHVQLQTLDFPGLAALTRNAGDGQAWRAGKAEWRSFSIALRD